MTVATPKSQNQRLVRQLTNKPPEKASSTTINFKELGFPQYKDHFGILIQNLFTDSECQALIEGAEASANHKWDQAMINVGKGQQMLSTDVRLCDRILSDDYEVAARILDRILPHLPADIVILKDKSLVTGKGPVKRKETWKISRLNERLRFLKYTKGMYFRPHCDGSYVTPDQDEITFLTVHLYLNGSEEPPAAQLGAEKDEDKPLLGGSTRSFDWFEEKHWDVNPRAGSVLVFQHRNLVHSGEDVRQGTKYTMRSDVLYRKVEN